MYIRKGRILRAAAAWFARAADRMTCFVRGHTPRRHPNYVYCAECGYIHQREERD